MDGDDVFRLQRTLLGTGFGLHLLAILGVDMYGSIGIDICLHSDFRRLEYGALEGIGIFIEDKRERNLHAGDAYIVFKHSCLDEVHAVTRVTDML